MVIVTDFKSIEDWDQEEKEINCILFKPIQYGSDFYFYTEILLER
jgi:hypothetical protein